LIKEEKAGTNTNQCVINIRTNGNKPKLKENK